MDALENIPTKTEWIHRLAKSGAYFSKHLRDTWTGELKQTTLRIEHFTGRQNDLRQIASLNPPLIDISACADLDGVIYMGAADQHTWDHKRWKAEIERRVK